MIKITLICGHEHEFESRFKDGKSFEKLNQNHMVSCPLCGDTNITRGLSAPFVQGSKKKTAKPVKNQLSNLSKSDKAKLDKEVMAKMMEYYQHVKQSHEDVGEQFPEIARQIHYGEIDKKDIHGKANLEQVKALTEEGISIMPLPFFDDETHKN